MTSLNCPIRGKQLQSTVVLFMSEKFSKEEKEKIFEEELLPHIDALNTFAYHLTYDTELAKDLVQETYLKAYKFTDHYDPGTNAKAWLFKILKNAYINNYRKRTKAPQQVELEEFKSYHDTDEGSDVQHFDLRDDIFDNLMGDEVTIAINSLPVDFRTVILLCDIEGFTYEEIAKIIDIPIGTVRSRLFRARNLLKEKLKEYAKNFGFKDKR